MHIIFGIICIMWSILLYLYICGYKKEYREHKEITERMLRYDPCEATVVRICSENYSATGEIIINIEVEFFNGIKNETIIIPYEFKSRNMRRIKKGDRIKIYYDFKSNLALPEHMIKSFRSEYTRQIALSAVGVIVMFLCMCVGILNKFSGVGANDIISTVLS